MELSQAKPIELGDKDLFDKYFKMFPPEVSEFTFTNLFMWRNYYSFLFLEVEDHLVLYSEDYLKKLKPTAPRNANSLYFLPPIGPDPVKIMNQIFETFDEVEFYKVPQEIIAGIKTHKKFPSLNIEIIDDRNNWDYVYDIEHLKNLPGNRYRQNRRWLRKFLETYQFEYQIISEDLIDKVKKLQKEWWLLRRGE
ncbi:MAG: phosphatidylglycerol lysyltransferase domain-containing protein, partial [Candidatus Thorarchaeota archaeon]